jgi:hypothetical protein
MDYDNCECRLNEASTSNSSNEDSISRNEMSLNALEKRNDSYGLFLVLMVIMTGNVAYDVETDICNVYDFFNDQWYNACRNDPNQVLIAVDYAWILATNLMIARALVLLIFYLLDRFLNNKYIEMIYGYQVKYNIFGDLLLSLVLLYIGLKDSTKSVKLFMQLLYIHGIYVAGNYWFQPFITELHERTIHDYATTANNSLL